MIVGPAIDGLKKLQPEPYDFVFIDADNKSNLEYFIEAKRLIRQDGIIVRLSSSHLKFAAQTLIVNGVLDCG